MSCVCGCGCNGDLPCAVGLYGGDWNVGRESEGQRAEGAFIGAG